MKNYLQKFKKAGEKGVFRRLFRKYSGELKLSAATVASQLLPLITLPMIGRLVPPDSYGGYGLFLSVVSMISPLICLKYDAAVVTIRDDKRAAMLAVSCGALCAAAGLLAFLLAVLVSYFAAPPVWFWLLPAALSFSGGYYGTNGICLRDGRYSRIAAAAAIRSATLGVAQLLLCRICAALPSCKIGRDALFASALALGLTLSYLAGGLAMLTPALTLIKKYRYSREICSGDHICTRNVLRTMREYLPFVRFTFPAAGAASVASNILSPVISFVYGPAQLGCYTVAAKALAAPVTVISNPVSQVYFHDVSKNMTRVRMNSALRLLTLLAVPVYLLLFLLAEPVLPLLFGSDWAAAAWLIRLLCPLYAVRFVTVPFFSTAIVAGKQREALRWQKKLLFWTLVSLVTAFLPSAPFALLMTAYSMALGLCSLAFCRYNFRIAVSAADAPQIPPDGGENVRN